MINKLKIERKSQAAMEFLMTYGWALLVVIIAIAALAFFGILNPGKFLPTKCEIGPGLECLTYTANTDDSDVSDGDLDDNITLVIQNGLGETLNNFRINVSRCQNAYSKSTIVGTANVTRFPPGESITFRIPCDGMTQGTRFRSDLHINFSITSPNYEEIKHFKKGLVVLEVGLTSDLN